MKTFSFKLIALTVLAILFVVSFDLLGQNTPEKSRGELLDAIPDESIAILFEDNNGNLKQISLDGTVSDPVSTQIFKRPRAGSSGGGWRSYSVYGINQEYVEISQGVGGSTEFSIGNNIDSSQYILLSIPGVHEDKSSYDAPRPYPITWISSDEVLVTEGGIERAYEGLARYNVRTNEYKSLNVDFAYGQYVEVSPNGNWAFGRYNSDGRYDSAHGTTDKVALINLETGEERKLFDHTRVKGWIVLDKQYEDVNSAEKVGFSFSDCNGGENCTLPGAPTFYLPFMCGRSYAVSRDGECNTPSECGLYPGTSAFVSWHNYTSVHDGRPAIDFSDNQLAGTTNPPVYASTSGVVEIAGWENPNNQNQGFGLYVRISHDGGQSYSYYGHLSGVVVSAGQQVSTGDLIGYEGNTGQSSGEHIHFELKNQPGGDSFWPRFHETGFGMTPQQGYIYTSQNGTAIENCVLCCGTLAVEDATEISCGQEVGGLYQAGEGGYVSTYLSKPLSYSGPATWNLNGQEYMYKVFVDPGEFTVTLEHETDDVDVFVLKDTGEDFLDPLTDCVGESCGMFCGNNPPGTHTVEVTADENPNGGYYYVVVDAGANNSSLYSLLVDCQTLDACTPNPPVVDFGIFLSGASAGSAFDMVATVTNFGTGPATNDFTLGAYLNPVEEGEFFCLCWAYLIDMVTISSDLDPGEDISIPFEADCNNRGIPPGEYNIVFVVNQYPFSYVDEIVDGSGNFVTMSGESVVVSPGPTQPDLEIASYIENFSEPVALNSTHSFSYNITNTSSQTFSGDVEVGVFLNKNNPAYDIDDGVLVSDIVTVSLSSLGEGETSDWFDITFTVPDNLCVTELHSFCIYLDPNNSIDEGGKEQNTSCIFIDLGSPVVLGCIYPTACNYDPSAVEDDGSCEFPDGCTDAQASNYDPNANCNDGSCEYGCLGDLTGDGSVGTSDLLQVLSSLGCQPPDDCVDLDGDGATSSSDLLSFLSVFGVNCN